MTFTYNATVVRVIDGDTIQLDCDLGFGIWLRKQSFRLVGLNAREHGQPGGPEATAHLTALLPAGQPVTVSSIKADKYGGRYDADVTLYGRDLNALLVETSWAAAWDGLGTKPLPPWPRPDR